MKSVRQPDICILAYIIGFVSEANANDSAQAGDVAAFIRPVVRQIIMKLVTNPKLFMFITMEFLRVASVRCI